MSEIPKVRIANEVHARIRVSELGGCALYAVILFAALIVAEAIGNLTEAVAANSATCPPAQVLAPTAPAEVTP